MKSIFKNRVLSVLLCLLLAVSLLPLTAFAAFAEPIAQQQIVQGGSTKTVRVTFAETSRNKLVDTNGIFQLGDGGKGDVHCDGTYDSSTGKVTFNDVPTQSEKYDLTIAINNNYFVPTVTVGEKTAETFDCSPFFGKELSKTPNSVAISFDLAQTTIKESYTVSLNVQGAFVPDDQRPKELKDVLMTYAPEGSLAGKAVIPQVKNVSTATNVENAVASFDISLLVNGVVMPEPGQTLTFEMILDKETFPGTDYTVIREHNGELTDLKAEYDAETGTLRFDTDLFSTYTIKDISKGAVNNNPPTGITADNGTTAIIAGCLTIAALGLILLGRKYLVK